MSEYKYLDKDGLIYYHSKVKNLLGGKVDKETGKGLSTNDYTTTEKNKLNGIASGAEVNQNAFSNIAVGSTTIQADSKTDTLTLTAGSNITLTPNATSDSITIAATTITVDDSLSSTSTNPVQNKVINTALGNKVDKVDGKGLSTNDYTTDDMDKLADIEPGAQVNQYAFSKVEIERRIIEANRESSYLYIEGGDNVVLTVLDNDGKNYGFRISATVPDISGKEDKSNKVTSMTSSSTDIQYPSAKCVYDAIQNAIGSITGIDFEIVQTLPATGATGTIYLMSNGGAAQNIYDEYVYVNNAWEKIGSTDIDLSNYVQKTDMVSITNAEIDTIVS